jgi:hypothetical protein
MCVLTSAVGLFSDMPSGLRMSTDTLASKVASDTTSCLTTSYPRIFSRPRIEAVRIIDMSGSNSWADFAVTFRRTRSAYQKHEAAKADLKKLVPEDAREAVGHGLRAKRSKSGAISFDLLDLEALLWRLRRATMIETELLRIQAEVLRDRRSSHLAVRSRNTPPSILQGAHEDQTDSDPWPAGHSNSHLVPQSVSSARDLAHCFLRLANLDNGVFERLGRYESALSRQVVRILFLLKTREKLSSILRERNNFGTAPWVLRNV